MFYVNEFAERLKEVDPEKFEELLAEGRTMTLEQAVALALNGV